MTSATQIALTPLGSILLAICFFGLAAGYLIWGGQELFNWPPSSRRVDKSMGVWAFLLPGLIVLVAGIYVFAVIARLRLVHDAPTYMAALAFTVFGAHWLAAGYRRLIGANARPDAWGALVLALTAVLGVLAYISVGNGPLALVFVGLLFVYLSDAILKFGIMRTAKLVGFCRCVTAVLMIYCAYGATFVASLGTHVWL